VGSQDVSVVEPASGREFPYLGVDALAAFGLLGSPIYIYSFVTQRVCWSNPRSREFWDAASEEELHARDLGPFSAATAIRLAEYHKEFLSGGERVESWTFYPRGKAVSALCRCSGVRLDGHAEAMLVEIQTLKPLELPVSELRAIEALRHTPLMISLFSQCGAVLVRNPAALAKFDAFDRTLPDGADHLRAMFAQGSDYDALLDEARQSGLAHVTATIAVKRWPVHSVQLSLVTDPATGEPALLVAQQDISPLIQVSRQLAASEEALDSVLSLNVAPALVVAAEGSRVLKANYAAQALLGSQVAAGGEWFADSDKFEYLRGAVLTAGSGNAVLGLRTARGGTAWCSVSGARIRYADQDAMVLLISNVDQLYQTAAELELALDVERRTSDMQRRYMAIASHEFRTPLAVIDSTAQQIERKADTLRADQLRARAGRIREAVKRVLHLFDRTLESAAANLGSMGYAPERGQLADVIVAVARQFREQHPGAAITLDLLQLPEIALDAGLMEQAFTNLVGNAIKYSDGPARVEICAVAGMESVEVFVRDHGIGIAPAEREAVFGDHARGSNVGERPGTGLGLSIVRQIVQLHGGSIEIVDTPGGEGTTMRLIFPRP